MQENIFSIKNIFLHITKACNLCCSYCYFSAGKAMSYEMSTEDLFYIWPEIVAIHPQKLIYTGGEPLLRKDILALLSDFNNVDSDHNITRCLNTNGYFVTKKLARDLIGLVDEVRVSIDGIREHNDLHRGEGNFEKAILAFEHLYSVGFEPIAMITVTSKNIAYLEELICFLAEKKITRIHINKLRTIGRGEIYSNYCINPNEVFKVMVQAWKQIYPDQHLTIDSNRPKEISNCGVGAFINIMPNGDVYPCHMLMIRDFLCGNITKQSLSEICHPKGLLMRIASLDFNKLLNETKLISPTEIPYICLGDFLKKTKLNLISQIFTY